MLLWIVSYDPGILWLNGKTGKNISRRLIAYDFIKIFIRNYFIIIIIQEPQGLGDNPADDFRNGNQPNTVEVSRRALEKFAEGEKVAMVLKGNNNIKKKIYQEIFL